MTVIVTVGPTRRTVPMFKCLKCRSLLDRANVARASHPTKVESPRYARTSRSGPSAREVGPSG